MKWLKRVILFSLICAVIFGIYRLNIIPHLKYENSVFGILTYYSSVDKDQDGIDDQSDILESVRSYLALKPKYKSQYYGTGYPDDGQGVCTDVVAFGLKGAGYDLMELVYEDICEVPELYGIDVIDKNIDFRRVENLNVYFSRHAMSLTCDISQIEEWQGGDIVVFEGHIGIISDKRNHHGVPFVLHHASPFQMNYEEDILEYRNDIIGHYRIS